MLKSVPLHLFVTIYPFLVALLIALVPVRVPIPAPATMVHQTPTQEAVVHHVAKDQPGHNIRHNVKMWLIQKTQPNNVYTCGSTITTSAPQLINVSAGLIQPFTQAAVIAAGEVHINIAVMLVVILKLVSKAILMIVIIHQKALVQEAI